MKMHLRYTALATIILSANVFAGANYNSQNGSFVIPDVSVDGKLLYKNVTLQLDADKRMFAVVEVQAVESMNPKPTPKETFDVEGYTLNLFNCTRSATIPKNVVCNLTITNNQPDRLLYFFSSSTAYDNGSNAYALLSSTLANKTSGTYDKGASAQLIQGTTANLTASFSIPETVNVLSALTLDFSKYSFTKSFDHTFRNIAIQ